MENAESIKKGVDSSVHMDSLVTLIYLQSEYNTHF